MSARYPGHTPNPFSSSELGGLDLPPDEVAAAGRVARQLESAADRGTVKPSPDFTDRVMAAVASEPTPAPIVAAGSALRHLSLVALVASVRDAVRVTFGRGFPAAARVQAVALVLVAAVLAGSAGLATAGALGLFGNRDQGPAPSVVAPFVSPTPSERPEPTTTPEPTPTTGPTDGSMEPEATGTPEASETPEPGDTAEPAETHDSGGSGGSGGTTSTPRPTRTPSATSTPRPTENDGEHGGSSPTPTPSASASPSPSHSPDN
jgi:hypothetical protein